MNGGLLNPEGPLMRFLEKTGQLIALSVLWLLGCLPVVTIVTSTTALYYGVVKVVRRERGTVPREFWRSYRANLPRGIGAAVILGLIAVVLVWNLRLLAQSCSNLLRWGAILGLVLIAATGVYIPPVLSRFSMKLWSAWKLSFVMAVRYLPITLVLLLAAWLGSLVQFYVLPMPTVLILPGLACLGLSFLVEKALRGYMPPKEETDNAWYYE